MAAGIFILAALTDWLDGLIARRRNQVTTLGTLLDPIADKILVASALVSLLQIDKIAAWIVLVIIGRELAVRSEEHTSELQSRGHLVCRLLLEQKKHSRPAST